jgi:type I restriction enzyme S subunit
MVNRKDNKIKQTALGEIPEEWEEFLLSEVVEVGPKRELRKGTQAKFVSMADLKEFDKKIQGFTTREFSGGSKFANKDTLMARITPCLENGKTAFVDILEKQEIGGGSTEFIVLAAKENKTIPEFVYYLAISPEIRAQAIQSMTGTSGRQRVGPDVFDKIVINIPKISEQHAIAKILSDLDEKIELNQQMNKTLESIAQAIFKRWFVDFEFPGYEKTKFVNGLPEGWREGKFGELTKIQPGFAFKSADFTSSGYKVIKIANIQNGIVDFAQSDHVTGAVFQSVDKKFHLASGDVIIAMTGAEIGKIGIIPKNNEIMLLNQRVGKLVSDYYLWAYYMLKGIEIQSLIEGISSASSAQPNISNSDIESTEVIIPDTQTLKHFCQIGNTFFQRLISNLGENKILSQIRDSLLPKLMSGRIRVQN